jgi:hypothetical protein
MRTRSMRAMLTSTIVGFAVLCLAGAAGASQRQRERTRPRSEAAPGRTSFARPKPGRSALHPSCGRGLPRVGWVKS